LIAASEDPPIKATMPTINLSSKNEILLLGALWLESLEAAVV
jgi:hypothetical protein